MMFRDSILRVMQTIDLVELLAKAVTTKTDLDLPEEITHALLFDAPDRIAEFAVPYTYTEGVAECDTVCRMKSSQCFIGDYNGIAGVCEHTQQYPYTVIELQPQPERNKLTKAKEFSG